MKPAAQGFMCCGSCLLCRLNLATLCYKQRYSMDRLQCHFLTSLLLLLLLLLLQRASHPGQRGCCQTQSCFARRCAGTTSGLLYWMRHLQPL
jgi:hypothetical protein